MYFKTVSLSIALLAVGSNAFVTPSRTIMAAKPAMAFGGSPARHSSRVLQYASNNGSDSDYSEIERLRSMAAKLRAEAAALEAEKAKQLASAAEQAFRKFDTDKDGTISLKELKAGLEKVLKTEVSESRVKALMKEFDESGDGALQLEEFVGVDKLRNRLEALAREEKRLVDEAAKEAKLAEEAAALAEARLDLLNDKPPSNSDKLVSLLPYLFPLMDGLQFGRFLLQGEDNPAINVLALLFALYRSVPFGGLIVFFGLNFLSNNPSLNRLVRFNMQQAIFLDIALFFPGLIAGIYTFVLSGLGATIPPEVTALGTDAIFVLLVGAIAYSCISSILGITPDKIPIISQAVSDRIPTIDMFDDQGRFIPRELREKKDDKDKKDD